MPESITYSDATLAARKKRQQSTVQPTMSTESGVTDFKQTPDGGATLNYQGKPMTLQGPTSGTPTTKSTTSTATPQSEPVVAQAEVKEGIMSTNGGQAKEAYMTAEGTFDPNYIPKSEDEIFNLPIDEYTRQKYLSNFYNSKGANFDAKATPGSFDEELKIFQEKQAKDKSALETQAQEIKAQTEAEKTSGQSANRANLTSGREGVTSQGNAMTRDQIDLAFESRYNSKMSALQQQMESLNQQMVLQQQGLLQGRSDQIRAQMKAVADSMAELEKEQGEKQKQAMDTLKMLSDNGALANLDPDSIKYLEDAMPGAPPGVVQLLSQAATRKYGNEETTRKLEQATKGVTMMKDLVSSGVVLNNTAMMSFAQQTGLPLEAVMSFNMAAEQVMNDKTLTQQEKIQSLQVKAYELDQLAKGNFTEAAKQIDILKRLYAEGASPEIISAFKSAARITDQTDPVYQADLANKQLTNQINQKKLRGQPVGWDEMKDYAENYKILVDSGQEPSAVIPKGSMYGVQQTENGVKFSAQNGAAAGQCGHFVNDVFGKRIVKDSFQQKMSLTDPSITIPTPGMAFVQDVNTKYGHIGLVESVNLQNGTMNIVESNWRGDEKIGRRTIPISAASGFIRPPGGTSVTSGNENNGEYQKYVQEATAKGLPLADAKKYAAEKVKDTLKNGGANSNDAAQIAQDIMSPYSTLSLENLPTEQRAAVAKELNKLKEEAFKNGNTLGVIRASAGSKPLDATSLQSLEKVRMVKTQLDSLAQEFENGGTSFAGVDINPIVSIVRSNNPYDSKAQEIKAKLRSIVPSLARGVYGEVGVLTDSDIDNYSRTIANLSSTEDVSKKLTEATQQLVVNSIKNKLDTLARGGKDVSGFADVLMELEPEGSVDKNEFGPAVKLILDKTGINIPNKYSSLIEDDDYASHPNFSKY